MKQNEQGKPHPKGMVAIITDRKTGQKIPVIPRKGESSTHAVARVSKRH